MGLQSDMVDNRMKTRACTMVETDSQRAIKLFGDRQAGVNSRHVSPKWVTCVQQNLASDIVPCPSCLAQVSGR